MSKFSVTISGATLDDLYASAAAFASSGTANVFVDIAVSDTGDLTAQTTPPGSEPGPFPSAANPAPAPASDDDGPTDTNAPEYDSAGIPWDERIHAGTKGRNQDGTWKRRRNTSDVTYNIVMAELAQKTAGQQPAAAPVVPPTAQVPASPAGNVDGSAPTAAPPAMVPTPTMAAQPAIAPAVPAAPAAATPAIPPATAAPVPLASEPVAPIPDPAPGMAFQDFMPRIAKSMTDKKFTPEHLQGWLAQWHLTDISQLSADRVKTLEFYQWLKQSNLVD